MDGKTGFIFLLHPRNIPEYQGYTSPQGKKLEKIFQAKVPKKKADKVDFKSKLIRRTREGNYTLIKGKTHPEDIAINIYIPCHPSS